MERYNHNFTENISDKKNISDIEQIVHSNFLFNTFIQQQFKEVKDELKEIGKQLRNLHYVAIPAIIVSGFLTVYALNRGNKNEGLVSFGIGATMALIYIKRNHDLSTRQRTLKEELHNFYTMAREQ